MVVQAMKLERIPEVAMQRQVIVELGPAPCQLLGRATRSKRLLARCSQRDFTVHDAIADILACLNRAIRIEHARTAGKLDAALHAIAVRADEVAAVLECPCDPGRTGAFFPEPVRWET